jgi:hypothetical protein
LPATHKERKGGQRPGATIKYLRLTTSGAVGYGLGNKIKDPSGVAGVGSGTTTKHLWGAVGIGLGTSIQ